MVRVREEFHRGRIGFRTVGVGTVILGIVFLVTVLWPMSASAQIKKGRRFSKSGDCKSCHDVADITGDRPHEPVAKDDCKGCHLSHGMVGALRLKESGRQLCLMCHDGIELGLQREILHGPVAEGRCDACHDPHGTDHPMLLAEAGENACFICHDQAGFDRKHRHEPLDEGCFSCHEVHGADHPALLKVPAATLCAGCHEVDSNSFVSAHFDYAVAPESCTQCHTPHASDNDGLMTLSSHQPVAEGECTACHNDPGAAEPFGTAESDVSEMCLGCHDEGDVRPDGVHAAVADGDCLDRDSGSSDHVCLRLGLQQFYENERGPPRRFRNQSDRAEVVLDL